MPASTNVRAALYKVSLGLCAICKMDLRLDKKVPQFTGDAAHIRGEKPGSARYLPEDMTLQERNFVENLILLCPTHHRTIDTDESVWPVVKLEETKEAHEFFARHLIRAGAEWDEMFTTLDFVNVPRLAAMPGGAYLSQVWEQQGLALDSTLQEATGMAAGRVVAAAKKVLQSSLLRTVPIREWWTGVSSNDVAVVSFRERVYSKNPPSPEHSRPFVAGETGPHLWFDIEERKVRVRYDPAWVTTATAFDNLTMQNRLTAGLGLVMGEQDNVLVVSALAFGHPAIISPLSVVAPAG